MLSFLFGISGPFINFDRRKKSNLALLELSASQQLKIMLEARVSQYVIIAHQETEFEAITTVNLTALLVLTTLFIGISNSLPNTAYVKLIDIWLIGHLLIPFFEVLLHTFIDFLRTEVARIEAKRVFVNRGNQAATESPLTTKIILRAFIAYGKYGLPAIYTVLIITFAAYGNLAN